MQAIRNLLVAGWRAPKRRKSNNNIACFYDLRGSRTNISKCARFTVIVTNQKFEWEVQSCKEIDDSHKIALMQSFQNVVQHTRHLLDELPGLSLTVVVAQTHGETLEKVEKVGEVERNKKRERELGKHRLVSFGRLPNIIIMSWPRFRFRIVRTGKKYHKRNS